MEANNSQKGSNRSLDTLEIRRLMAADKAAKADQSLKRAANWPGSYNMQLLAEAVNKRRRFVEFEGGKRFTIRYDDKRNEIFIKPADETQFVPCGYVPYDRLKAVLIDE